MSFDVNQMPESNEEKPNESEKVAASLGVFKIWFIGIVLVCATVIVGAAIFYYQLNNS